MRLLHKPAMTYPKRVNGCDIYLGNSLEVLKTLPDQSIHSCITSPPYYGLRNYGVAGQLGLQETPEEYVDDLIKVFREVHRALRDDGTLWLNLGDTYWGSWGNSGSRPELDAKPSTQREKNVDYLPRGGWDHNRERPPQSRKHPTIKPKDLIGIPGRVAFALQQDGWWLRQDIIWHKPNVMPESVKDRCTKSHEYIFLLSKSAKYYFDSESVKEPSIKFEKEGIRPRTQPNGLRSDEAKEQGGFQFQVSESRNRRSVWSIPTKPYRSAHFAVYPPDLIRPCVLAGSPKGGRILDPFLGSGTTLAVAVEEGRTGVGIELNPDYLLLAESRINQARRES